MDRIAGDAARMRNSGRVRGALRPECEPDCARRAERVGESEPQGTAVVSCAGIEHPQAGPSFLASVRASGQVSYGPTCSCRNVAATRVSAKVSLDGGKLQISELNGDFLGGKHRGQWQADFGRSPRFAVAAGSLTGVSLARLADAMKDGWIAGTANTSYEVKGPCPAEFWKSAEGMLQFEMQRWGAAAHRAGRGCGSVEGHASGRAGAVARGYDRDERREA